MHSRVHEQRMGDSEQRHHVVNRNGGGGGGDGGGGSGRGLRRATREPHTLHDDATSSCGLGVVANGVRGRNVGIVGSSVTNGVSARPVALGVGGGRGGTAAHLSHPPFHTPSHPSLLATSLAPFLYTAAPQSKLSPVDEWKTKYQNSHAAAGRGGEGATMGGGATTGGDACWESPRIAPPLPTRFSPHVRYSKEDDGLLGVGWGSQWVPPSPLVRAKDNLMNSFCQSGTPVRQGEGSATEGVEASPLPRSCAPAPVAVAVAGSGDEVPGGEGEYEAPRRAPPAPYSDDISPANSISGDHVDGIGVGYVKLGCDTGGEGGGGGHCHASAGRNSQKSAR